ncbi:hypothetical protein HMPREF9303_2005 [Prevotella denticola CRIS 18C-A]|uniref:Uncharacterized protein n=1 Tax=Prevotella denticola CRIS 18C-A TaxID=944557 RepID=F0H4Q6_9BACT|nr:hypothetical protein HMPREF9303_2005 [Prevotella denticola CRIS 18C-A]
MYLVMITEELRISAIGKKTRNFLFQIPLVRRLAKTGCLYLLRSMSMRQRTQKKWEKKREQGKIKKTMYPSVYKIFANAR